MRLPGFINRRGKEVHKTDDLGLSSSYNDSDERVVNKDGTFNIERVGQLTHVYYYLVKLSWLKFFAVILTFFSLVNGVFALAYLLIGVDAIGITPQVWYLDFIETFHFSVQTMTTVGYGAMFPKSMIAGVVASLEALVGLLMFALASGLMFGRFSLPTSQIRFSQWAVINELGGRKTIQLRIANQYSHDLMQVEADILMLLDSDIDGQIRREYIPLELELSSIRFMPLNWTLVHTIDENSPLYNMNAEELAKRHTEFLVSLKFYDESFARTMHSKSSYRHNEIKWNHRFLPAYTIQPSGKTRFHLDKLDDIEKV